MTETRQRTGQRSGWVARMAEAARRWSLTRAARRVLRARPTTPPRWPEPRTVGSAARGRRLLEGRMRVGAEAHEAPGLVPWDLAEDDPSAADIHAMGWLDDLAALGDTRARNLAQDWVSDWVGRYGEGLGPGWEPALAARRLLRLLAQARFLLHPRGEGEGALADTVALHLALLERRLKRMGPGPDRLLALAAALQARLALGGRTPEAERLRDALGQEAAAVVDPGGGVATRSPEDLLETLALLAGAEEALKAAEMPTDPRLGAALARAAPVLRALRHADGGLARFQGGGRGAEGLAEKVLSAAGRPAMGGARSAPSPQMGYLRLAAGRTTVIVDAAPPPAGPASLRAHASTLALELTSGRRPLVVSCGPGEGFGAAWARATRATASHSTLALEQASSARLAPPRAGEGAPRLVEGPRRVILEASPPGPEGLRVELAQDGWRGRFGLTHARLLRLAPDGRRLEGEDMLTTLTGADGALLDRALEAAGGLGLPFAVRFHLHHGVEAEMREDGRVAARLPSGEVWLLGHDGAGVLSLEPSVYLEAGALRPRETLQAVIASRALGPTTKLRWTWAKSPDSPEGLRDLAPNDDEEDE